MNVPHGKTLRSDERQANRPDHGSLFCARLGFSIIELLIMLAVLTTVTALVLPALKGPLECSRLRCAAVDVQSAWSRARAVAIREGMSVNFQCQTGGRHWKIERVANGVRMADEYAPAGQALLPVSGETGRSVRPVFGQFSSADRLNSKAGTDNETATELHSTTDQVGGQKHSHPRAGSLVCEGWLPDGVTFAEFGLGSTTCERRVSWNDENDDGRYLVSAGSEWSRPLKFRPDGRSSDAQVFIAGAGGFVVRVDIRGLTSGVTFTAPFTPKIAQPDSGGRL